MAGWDGLGWVMAILWTLIVAKVQDKYLLTDAHLVPIGGCSGASLGLCQGLLLGSLLDMATWGTRIAHASLPTAKREHLLAAYLTPRLHQE